MRRKGRGLRNNVLIDLTSLLDVIFILLLILLCGQAAVSDDLNEARSQAEYAKTEAEYAKAQAEEERQLYEEQQEAFANVWAVSIIVPYDENEITRRQIRFLKQGEEIQSIDLIGNDTAGAVNEFKESLVKYIEQNQGKPVILSVNENDDYILYRDEVMVDRIFDELVQAYANVYIVRGSADEETR